VAPLVAGVLLAPRRAHADNPPPTSTPVAASPTPVATALSVSTYPPGVPAITPQPRLRAQALATTATDTAADSTTATDTAADSTTATDTAADSTTATDTAADVRAFLAAHPLFQTADGSAPVIDAIDVIPG